MRLFSLALLCLILFAADLLAGCGGAGLFGRMRERRAERRQQRSATVVYSSTTVTTVRQPRAVYVVPMRSCDCAK